MEPCIFKIDLAAFLAGNDVLLISEDVPRAILKMREAYDSGVISEDRLEYSVKKILQAKYKVGLHEFQPIKIENLVADLNRPKDDVLNDLAFEKSITIVKNKSNLLPVRDFSNKKIAYVHLGDDSGATFFKELQKYTKVHEIKGDNLDELLEKLWLCLFSSI